MITARIKAPIKDKAWPAFWMLPQSQHTWCSGCGAYGEPPASPPASASAWPPHPPALSALSACPTAAWHPHSLPPLQAAGAPAARSTSWRRSTPSLYPTTPSTTAAARRSTTTSAGTRRVSARTPGLSGSLRRPNQRPNQRTQAQHTASGPARQQACQPLLRAPAVAHAARPHPCHTPLLPCPCCSRAPARLPRRGRPVAHLHPAVGRALHPGGRRAVGGGRAHHGAPPATAAQPGQPRPHLAACPSALHRPPAPSPSSPHPQP
jgi:hypothetical protein